MATVYDPSVPADRPTGLWARLDDDRKTPRIKRDTVSTPFYKELGSILGGFVGFLFALFVVGQWIYRYFDRRHYLQYGAEMRDNSLLIGATGLLLIALAGLAVGVLLAHLAHNWINRSNADVSDKKVAAPGIMAFVLSVGGVILLSLPLWAGSVQLANPLAFLDPAAPAPVSSATPAATPSAEACDPMYVQVAGNNANGRVDDGFAAKYAAATANAGNMSEAQIGLLLEEAGHNAHTLAIWSHPFGLHADANDWDELVDGDCLSAEGIKLHNQLDGALNAEGTIVEEASAPEGWYNTGVQDGVFGVNATPGIYGDRKAIKITLKDGTVVYIMVRCGNVVYPAKPPVPDVPTDNPPPPPPPAVCEFDSSLPPDSPFCLAPKKPGESTNVNPLVPDWITDAGEQHPVNNNDGASDSQGYQADPQGDAEKAQQAAEQAQQVVEEEHQEAIEEAESSGGGNVEPGPVATGDPTPPADW